MANLGIKLLKRVCRGGVDPIIYGFDTTKDEKDVIRTQNSKKYEKLCRQCGQLLKFDGGSLKLIESSGSPIWTHLFK